MARKQTRSAAQCHKGSATYNQSRPCRFLDLPGEIRNRICQYVQHFDQSTTLSLHRDLSDTNIVRPSPQQPSLARTCRQLRSELLSTFYGERTFEIDPEIGVEGSIGAWATITRQSLGYLRSITFMLFTEYTAVSAELQNGLCDVVNVHAWLTEGNMLAYRIRSPGVCECKFARCARDVERGILGSPDDAPLIRFLKAWDIEAPPVRGDRLMVCNGCGGGNVQVSLRDIRRRPSLPSSSSEEVEVH